MLEPLSFGGPGLAGAAGIIALSTVVWFLLAATIIQSPLIGALTTKESTGVTKLDVVERGVGFTHAAVSSGFGLYAWLAVTPGMCTYDAQTEMILRFGVALTTGYLIYDWILLLCVEVIYKIRDVWWTMWLHHASILSLFFAGLAYSQISWFMAAHLVNEISTMPLQAAFFMKNHKWEGTRAFIGVVCSVVISFTFFRVIAIPAIGYMFYTQDGCSGKGVGTYLASHAWTVIGLHLIVNLYWYSKLMWLVVRPPKEEPSERMPLIAQEAGLGPAPTTPRNEREREEELTRGR